MNEVALGQGVFYVATGLWPTLHWRSFEAVTGPKVDRWLVKTTGGLIATIGAALIVSALEPRVRRATRVLGLGATVALGLADLVYARRGRIRDVYLVDAVVEAALAGGWAAR